MKKTLFFTLLAVVILAGGCGKKPLPGINIEQAGHAIAEKILAPGLGTIGLIDSGKVYVYYTSEDRRWMLDKQSQFSIPEDNEGLIALGMGTIGIVRGNEILFSRLNAYNEWVADERITFGLPRKYDRIISVKMPWDLGVLAVEDEGFLTFYYRSETDSWTFDETATFKIPEGIEGYFSLGDMTIAVTDKGKLGFYYLDNEGVWQFANDYVLQLPENTQAIIPWESSIIAVLVDTRLEFFMLDMDQGGWLQYEDMAFELPFGAQLP